MKKIFFLLLAILFTHTITLSGQSMERVLNKYCYNAGGWRVEKHPRMVGDINGDGRDDLIGFGGGKVIVELGQANGTFRSAPKNLENLCYGNGWRIEKHPRMIGDFNGDGRDDLIGFGSSKVFVELGERDGTFKSAPTSINDFSYNNGWRVEKHPRLVGDVNGDGRDDIIAFGSSRVFVELGQSNGTFRSAPNNLENLCYANGWRVEKHPRMMGDVNGDGRADIIGFGTSKVFVKLGQADGSFKSAPTSVQNLCYGAGGWRVGKNPRLIGDVNGDGRADIVGFGNYKVFVELGQPDGTFRTASSNLTSFCYNAGNWRAEKHPLMLGDVNADGRADIIGFGTTYVFISLGNRDGSFQAPVKVVKGMAYTDGWRTEKHPRMIGDFDGDKRSDLLGFGNSYVFVLLGSRM